jgi:hypothetical protein
MSFSTTSILITYLDTAEHKACAQYIQTIWAKPGRVETFSSGLD